MTYKFNIDSYKKLHESFIDLEYDYVGYDCKNLTGKKIISRHDIDMCVSSALKIARVEAKMKVKSIFFVLITTPLYNIHDESVKDSLMEILELGHSIGLHFDASLSKTQDDGHNRCTYECSLLERALNCSISVISFHRPSNFFINMPEKFIGKLHTYQPEFTKNIGYCSDSRGEWRFGYPTSNSFVKKSMPIQLLTHPIWWAKSNDFVQEKIDSLISDIVNRDRLYIDNNCIPYKHEKVFKYTLKK